MRPKNKLNKKPIDVPLSRLLLTQAARLEHIALDLLAVIPPTSSLINRKAIAKQLKDENAKLNYFEKQVANEIARGGKQ